MILILLTILEKTVETLTQIHLHFQAHRYLHSPSYSPSPSVNVATYYHLSYSIFPTKIEFGKRGKGDFLDNFLEHPKFLCVSTGFVQDCRLNTHSDELKRKLFFGA